MPPPSRSRARHPRRPNKVSSAPAPARAGGLKGGVGTASTVLPNGTVVAALVVVNAVGSCVDPRTGELYAVRFGFPGEFPELPAVDPDRLAAAKDAAAAEPTRRSNPRWQQQSASSRPPPR